MVMMMEKSLSLAITCYSIAVGILLSFSSSAYLPLQEWHPSREMVIFLKQNSESKASLLKNFQLGFLLLLLILMIIHLRLPRLVPIPLSLSILILFSKRTALLQVLILNIN